MPTTVSQVRAAEPMEALAHFESMLRFETDCWDVHHAVTEQQQDFVLMDVRSPTLYAQGHLPSAINILHGKLTSHRLKEFSDDTLFVVYCAGPHCNGANKAAVHLSRMGRPVKMMIGGIEGWKDEGFDLIQ